MSPPRRLVRGPLLEILGLPGLLIGLFALLTLGFGMAIRVREADRLLQAGREAARTVLSGWVRGLPVDYLGQTLTDYADAWQHAPSDDRPEREQALLNALARFGERFDRPEVRRIQIIELESLTLGPIGAPPLGSWRSLVPKPPARIERSDRFTILASTPQGRGLELTVRYRLSSDAQRALGDLEELYQRLALAVLVLSLFPLLCLLYMMLQATALRERAAREAAREATLDLADRTCHELGNVSFVLANERRNLGDHLELVQRFVDEESAILARAAEQAGLDADATRRLLQALGREHAARGLEPTVELEDSVALARDVCRQVAVCSDFISLTIRELDSYLKQSALPVHLVPVDLDTCLDDAIELLGPRLELGGVAVERPPRMEATVLADRRLLLHALVNLIKNALEATTTGGRAPRISFTADMKGPTCWLCIADNGPGLPAEALGRIFEFGYSTKGPGRGRGLAIVLESVQAQHGQLEVSNRPGGGLEFRIGLPLTERKA